MHLVLHGGEEQLGFLLALPVVAGQREDLPNPLVDPRFTGANLPDADQQFIKIVHQPAAALQPFVVEGESLDKVLVQAGGSPLAELHPAQTLDPVTYCENGFKVIMKHPTGDLPGTFMTNY